MRVRDIYLEIIGGGCELGVTRNTDDDMRMVLEHEMDMEYIWHLNCQRQESTRNNAKFLSLEGIEW